MGVYPSKGTSYETRTNKPVTIDQMWQFIQGKWKFDMLSYPVGSNGYSQVDKTLGVLYHTEPSPNTTMTTEQFATYIARLILSDKQFPTQIYTP